MGIALAAAALHTAPPAPARAQSEVAPLIQAIVDGGTHAWLRWARFPDYQAPARAAYEAGQFAPLWLDDGKPTSQAGTVVAALAGADARGLSPADYDAARLHAEATHLGDSDGTAVEMANFDTALTVSLMRFVSDSYVGRINPRAVGFGLDIEPKKLDLPALVRELAVDADPGRRLAGLDPPFPSYAHLAAALPRYRALAVRSDLAPMPALPKIRPGDRDANLPALRAWLVALGDLPADQPAPADPALFDETLAVGVAHFQNRHGLEGDAIIGPATLRALQTPMATRVRQIELAMERLRWLPYDWPQRFILVNIPEFRLRGYESGNPEATLRMNVVVGSAARKHYTPVLHAEMKYLVWRPYWLVPPKIAREEIFPKADANPAYLARQNMEVVDGRVRQLPGRNNSLGLVKFIFPNPHHVYLHDTPSKALFARTRRDFSHGCIRVADPPALAEFVLQGLGGWDRPRIEQAMQRGPDNRRLDLASPVPVYVFYTTVVIDDEGHVDFFDDIYGHDATLERLLAKGYPYPG